MMVGMRFSNYLEAICDEPSTSSRYVFSLHPLSLTLAKKAGLEEAGWHEQRKKKMLTAYKSISRHVTQRTI